MLHLASDTEPTVEVDAADGRVMGMRWTPLAGAEYGDTVGFIDWSAVTALSWRWAP